MRPSGFALSVCTILAMASLAQPAARGQAHPFQQIVPQPAASPALRMGRYNKATEAVTSGTIVSVESAKNAALPRGTYLILRSGGLTLNVHMGLFSPATIPFAAGDAVQITGSLVSVNGNQLLLARQVQSAGKTLTVRSSSGFVLRPAPAGRAQGLQQ